MESTRSAGAWKVPTLSAREWRNAAEEALGANGSCTCTKSNEASSRSSSIVRATSSGSDTFTAFRVGGNGRLWPTAITCAHPGAANTASGSCASRFTTCRPSRISSRESDGAITTTLCPRRQSSSETRST